MACFCTCQSDFCSHLGGSLFQQMSSYCCDLNIWGPQHVLYWIKNTTRSEKKLKKHIRQIIKLLHGCKRFTKMAMQTWPTWLLKISNFALSTPQVFRHYPVLPKSCLMWTNAFLKSIFMILWWWQTWPEALCFMGCPSVRPSLSCEHVRNAFQEFQYI